MNETYTFSAQQPIVDSDYVESDNSLIEDTPNLRRASFMSAIKYGGPLVRSALEVAPLTNNHEHILVDTKVSLLMKDWFPAIPGWHTDGVPRGPELNPAGKGEPSMREQQRQSDAGYNPAFHTIIFGNPCLTEFVANPMSLTLDGESRKLYEQMSRLVKDNDPVNIKPPLNQWCSWDWWNIHTATPATESGWRLLIRITESVIPPVKTDFIRTQNQVYVPVEFGW